jgi:Ala-tRNA(Pro) deacylase
MCDGAWLIGCMSESRLFADIAALGIDYALIEHEAVFTVEESSKLDRDIPGAHTKNLFLRDAGGKYWLVTVPAHMRVDLKQLQHALGCKRVSFGKADDMVRLLGIAPGSVTPLAVINDAMGEVAVVLHAGLLDAGPINVHPLRNSATLGLAVHDLLRLLQHWNHKAVIAEIPAVK